jgi:hypothetical protein
MKPQNSPKIPLDTASDKYISRMVNRTPGFAKLPERIRERVTFQACENTSLNGDCWIWCGPLYSGYGRVSIAGNQEKAHRGVYILLRGPIPSSLELDHLCLHRNCVNPDHLEPVTRLENIRRSHTVGLGNGTRTHCRSGHEFTPENTMRHYGKRYCRACQGRNARVQRERGTA